MSNSNFNNRTVVKKYKKTYKDAQSDSFVKAFRLTGLRGHVPIRL
jgi:hypothetical protein